MFLFNIKRPQSIFGFSLSGETEPKLLKLRPCRFNHESLPGDYIFPPELRPGDLKIPFGSNISVIDLSEEENGNRTNTIQKIIKASEEFGFFQVQIMITFFLFFITTIILLLVKIKISPMQK